MEVRKRKVTDLIEKRCKRYQEDQKESLLADDGGRTFFKQTKTNLSKQRPRPFDVMDMFPGRDESYVAEHLASHFNEISNEFEPLDFSKDIPPPTPNLSNCYNPIKWLSG